MKLSQSWSILFACYAVSFVWVLNNSSVPILLPIMKQEFNLSYFESGLISTASMVTYCAMQFPVGLIADRFGKKNIILTGALWVAVTLILTGLTQTYAQFLLCLIIVGIGNGMHFIPVSSLVSETFSLKERGKALSISGSAMAVSRVSTAFFAVPIAVVLGWRNLFLMFSLLGFIAGAAFWRIAKEKKAQLNMQPSTEKVSQVRAFFRADLMKLSTIAHITGYSMVIQTFITLFLIQVYEMSATEAAIHSMIPYIAWGVGAPINGIIIDRLGRKKAIIASSLLLAAASIVLVLVKNYPLMILMIIAIGFSHGLQNPAILAYSTGIVRENMRTAEMGLMNTFWVLGSVIGPAVSGILADLTSFTTSLLVFNSIPLIAIVLSVFWLKE